MASSWKSSELLETVAPLGKYILFVGLKGLGPAGGRASPNPRYRSPRVRASKTGSRNNGSPDKKCAIARALGPAGVGHHTRGSHYARFGVSGEAEARPIRKWSRILIPYTTQADTQSGHS